MTRPPAQESRDTRREILDAALDLFAERGFHATSVRAIARAVGVRESALYHHFASKDAILEGVIEERASARISAINQEVAAIGDRSLSEILTQLTERALAQIEAPKERRFLRLAMSLGVPMLDEHSPFHRMLQARLAFEQLIALLKQTGRVRGDVNAEVFTLHFTAPLLVASGAILGGSRGVLRSSLKQFVKDHVAFLVRAVGATAG